MPDDVMFENLWPLHLGIDATTLAGVGLWALAFYLGFSPVSDWVIDQLSRWFSFAERSLYTSSDEYEKTRSAREAVNTLYASLLSIIPFLVVGGLLNYAIELSLGQSWAISVGMLACMGAGIYELGRRDGKSSS